MCDCFLYPSLNHFRKASPATPHTPLVKTAIYNTKRLSDNSPGPDPKSTSLPLLKKVLSRDIKKESQIKGKADRLFPSAPPPHALLRPLLTGEQSVHCEVHPRQSPKQLCLAASLLQPTVARGCAQKHGWGGRG